MIGNLPFGFFNFKLMRLVLVVAYLLSKELLVPKMLANLKQDLVRFLDFS